jgi:hypothetical protein
MSYNKIQINNQKPNENGDVTVNLNNIITINSPVSGQLLQKSSTDWGTSTLATSISGLLNFYDDYGPGNSTYYYAVGDNYASRSASTEYNVNDFTLITAWGTYSPLNNNNWSMAYRVNASTYPSGTVILLRAVIGPYRHSNSNITVQWFKGSSSTASSNNTPIGNKAFSNNEYGATAFGLLECNGTDIDVMLRVVDVSGNVAITTGYMSRVQQITAKQLK